jgi:hypothetical protein
VLGHSRYDPKALPAREYFLRRTDIGSSYFGGILLEPLYPRSVLCCAKRDALPGVWIDGDLRTT